MRKHFHTLVIGGGCLGCAAAISLARRLAGTGAMVGIIEKSVLGAGLSSRHSAIVRSANASPAAAYLARESTRLWRSLEGAWGVAIPYEQPGAIWISPASDPAVVQRWQDLAAVMQSLGVEFSAIGRDDARALTGGAVRLGADELFFHEPEVLQLDAADVLHGLQSALALNQVILEEHSEAVAFRCDDGGSIRAVVTPRGEFGCDHVVNAAGAWSTALFARLGIDLPLGLEPVFATNWLVSARDMPAELPIIADFCNRAYFRRWRGSILHLHQPRERTPAAIAVAFSRSRMNPAGADVIYDAYNYGVSDLQVASFRDKIRNRFPAIDAPLYAGGYLSFFDITPDLRFILGRDSRIENLVHVLGGGQALKYAPVFGQVVADLILDGSPSDPRIDLSDFSPSRFAGVHLSEFLRHTEGHNDTL